MATATPATTVASEEPRTEGESQRLEELLSRIHRLTAEDKAADAALAAETDPAKPTAPQPAPTPTAGPTEPQQAENKPPASPSAEPPPTDGWYPPEIDSFHQGGLTDSEVENLILKYLSARAEASGREICEQIKLPFRLIDPLMQRLKDEQFVAHKGSAMMNDYIYQLTSAGRDRGKKLTDHCTYYGSAPVPLKDYIEAVGKQTIASQHPTEDDLARAFKDLLIDKRMLLRLGPAVNSGKGLFLFGAPGNGKTSIAERVTAAYGKHVWIPRTLNVDGEVMRLFDPSMHEEAPLGASEGLIDDRRIDHRWVRIERPTIVAGGELTMDMLEVRLNTQTNVSEAPLQLKSNCGTLVIDDFGRQRMTTDELLNRWIVPLEKRYDYLNLASGKKIQVPFDQLVIFSTNLEPRDLVDGAFLRRIPYKIEVVDPEESAFRKLVEIMGKSLGVPYDQAAVDYLIEKHYRAEDRPFRCCQPRDLLQQIVNYCRYTKRDPVMSPETFDFAVENYFSVM